MSHRNRTYERQGPTTRRQHCPEMLKQMLLPTNSQKSPKGRSPFGRKTTSSFIESSKPHHQNSSQVSVSSPISSPISSPVSSNTPQKQFSESFISRKKAVSPFPSTPKKRVPQRSSPHSPLRSRSSPSPQPLSYSPTFQFSSSELSSPELSSPELSSQPSSPRHSSPRYSSPQHFSSQHSSPQHFSPQHFSSQNSSSQHSSSRHSSSQHSSSQHYSPQHSSPQHSSPQHSSPQHSPPQHSSPQHPSPQHSSYPPLTFTPWNELDKNATLDTPKKKKISLRLKKTSPEKPNIPPSPLKNTAPVVHTTPLENPVQEIHERQVDRKGSQSPIILLSDDEDFEVERDDVGAGCDRAKKSEKSIPCWDVDEDENPNPDDLGSPSSNSWLTSTRNKILAHSRASARSKRKRKNGGVKHMNFSHTPSSFESDDDLVTIENVNSPQLSESESLLVEKTSDGAHLSPHSPESESVVDFSVETESFVSKKRRSRARNSDLFSLESPRSSESELTFLEDAEPSLIIEQEPSKFSESKTNTRENKRARNLFLFSSSSESESPSSRNIKGSSRNIKESPRISEEEIQTRFSESRDIRTKNKIEKFKKNLDLFPESDEMDPFSNDTNPSRMSQCFMRATNSSHFLSNRPSESESVRDIKFSPISKEGNQRTRTRNHSLFSSDSESEPPSSCTIKKSSQISEEPQTKSSEFKSFPWEKKDYFSPTPLESDDDMGTFFDDNASPELPEQKSSQTELPEFKDDASDEDNDSDCGLGYSSQTKLPELKDYVSAEDNDSDCGLGYSSQTKLPELKDYASAEDNDSDSGLGYSSQTKLPELKDYVSAEDNDSDCGLGYSSQTKLPELKDYVSFEDNDSDCGLGYSSRTKLPELKDYASAEDNDSDSGLGYSSQTKLPELKDYASAEDNDSDCGLGYSSRTKLPELKDYASAEDNDSDSGLGYSSRTKLPELKDYESSEGHDSDADLGFSNFLSGGAQNPILIQSQVSNDHFQFQEEEKKREKANREKDRKEKREWEAKERSDEQMDDWTTKIGSHQPKGGEKIGRKRKREPSKSKLTKKKIRSDKKSEEKKGGIKRRPNRSVKKKKGFEVDSLNLPPSPPSSSLSIPSIPTSSDFLRVARERREMEEKAHLPPVSELHELLETDGLANIDGFLQVINESEEDTSEDEKGGEEEEEKVIGSSDLRKISMKEALFGVPKHFRDDVKRYVQLYHSLSKKMKTLVELQKEQGALGEIFNAQKSDRFLEIDKKLFALKRRTNEINQKITHIQRTVDPSFLPAL